MTMESNAPLSAADVARLLELAPHPEGGFYRETFRDPRAVENGRAASTAIYYLLGAGEVSAWHRVDAAEIWHFYAGAPLAVDISAIGDAAERRILGPGLTRGERPQIVVPAGHWQSARSLGAWTLVGCTVAPGFEFSRFELAPAHFRPPRPDGGE
ncbi:cupin domain-containing protein [Methylosinus sp. H3A]|uniref:cupin domain-containing protein n=1 Tax=Methylosinus sp. H3A TaxID=2785786 RepID=UPI0018C2DD75|nr:cupin domain-containing protein [Methylosinus sp. H3A]MBG0811059.1 cupin domain-containing protein [Methylosinus sp. H3A]